MRSRLTLMMAVLGCVLGTAAAAQTIRGIHAPARVTPVDPTPPAPEAPPAIQPPAAAPDEDSTAVEGVTVEAKRLTPPQVEKRALRFVQAYVAPTAKIDQFARWRDPVCVQVTSRDPALASDIETRIKAVAKTTGVKVQRPGCKANIEIVFANDPQNWLDWVAQHRDSVLGFHYVRDTEDLKKITRPIQAWYETSTRSDGLQGTAGLAFGVAANETIDNPVNAAPAGCGDSRFSSCLQSVFSNVLVFVDNSRLNGRDVGAMADYLAMLVLSQPRSLDGCAAFPSIIDLLAPNCPAHIEPDGLTSADMAYLKALYGADLEARRTSEESDIASRMARSLIKARN
jgi:hypothetical protein